MESLVNHDEVVKESLKFSSSVDRISPEYLYEGAAQPYEDIADVLRLGSAIKGVRRA